MFKPSTSEKHNNLQNQGFQQSSLNTNPQDPPVSRNLREINGYHDKRRFGIHGVDSKLENGMENFEFLLHCKKILRNQPIMDKDAAGSPNYRDRAQEADRSLVKSMPIGKHQKKSHAIDTLTKDSDMSDFQEDTEPHDETRPLESGWEYALFLRKEDLSEGISQVYLFSREKLFFAVKVEDKYVDKFGKTIYIRYKQRSDGSYMMFPSSHHYSTLFTLKVRPQKSVEMKLTGVVGFSGNPEISVPVWNDIIGWKTLFTKQPDLLRKGLSKVDGERVRRALVVVEFVVQIRTDIPSEFLHYYTDSIKITDLAPLEYLNGKSTGEIPSCYYPKEPRRIDDLKYAARGQEGEIMFKSMSLPHIKVQASFEQCSISKEEKDLAFSAVVVPVEKDVYRGLVIAPKMTFAELCGVRLFDYKRILSKRVYNNNQDAVIGNVKEIFSRIFNNSIFYSESYV